MIRVLPTRNGNTVRFQPRSDCRIGLRIASRNLPATLGEKVGNTRHSDAAHPHQMHGTPIPANPIFVISIHRPQYNMNPSKDKY